MHILWKKAVKSPQRQGLRPQPPLASGERGVRPQTPALLLSLIDIHLSKVRTSISLLRKINRNNKQHAFASSTLLRLFFHSKSAVFVGGGAKIFFPRAQGTLTTPLITL